jgi:hypothetical protein
VIPQKLSDMFLNRQSADPRTTVPVTPAQPGAAPHEAPTLTLEMRNQCTTCGGDPLGELRAQREDVQHSINVEQGQKRTQQLRAQREEITHFQESEQRGEETTDQQIRDKLALLDQINQEIASQAGSTTPTQQSIGVPSGSQPTFLDLLRTNFQGFVNDLIHGGECAAVLAKFHVPLPVASALCLGYQQIKGDARAITKWAQDLVGRQGGSPMVVTPPPPPPPPQQVRFCMNCLDQNSALKFMSGQGSDGCFLEEEEIHG